MPPPAPAPLDPLTGMPAARWGLYVHFPYCRAKCPYCDFAVAVRQRLPEERYARAVLAELDLRLAVLPAPLRARPLESVFIGGGTPSLWAPRWVGEVLDGVAARLGIAPGAEVSLEANPAEADQARYAGYRAAGVNRLSLGVQSFDDRTLRALGRDHTGAQATGAVRAARRAGFDVVSLDVIYGALGQTRAMARQDAEHAAALEVEHLSAYALTVDREELAEPTPFARRLARGQLPLPPDEDVVEMARAQREVWERAGLVRYEVSNFARAGHSSRHNALYWTGGDYLALGVGATGLVHGGERAARRWSNARAEPRYLAEVEAGRLPEAEAEALGAHELFAERLAMGLRLTSGVDWEAVCRAHGEDPAPRRAEVERLLAHGLARRQDGRLALTDAGLDLHSEIAARLL